MPTAGFVTTRVRVIIVVAHKVVNKAAVVALVDVGSEFFQIRLKGEKMTQGEAP